ncbi:MAG: hypothetical protein A2275_04195 [Bacteroidetes bacterium RIFOXYA12_FULL_35_11]|nr:MAG: hypothetical protein A2X01_10335 [Bacteroidetes bacterium GWF2_35_48]OFY81019.1 MAG: hypothetical protein A2275_04195 [Bacteroidetes bacterium RIFOXYA12_FULL_35_11]HBX49954.1 hypothetical protein [Bacteroidales bacterium]
MKPTIKKSDTIKQAGINSKVIAFTTRGTPLVKKQYVQHIINISKDVKNDRFISHEEMLKETTQ